ncbi:MAG: bifunctional UDP-sugar hydrolase/5'-nucleotidase [Gammaproteobacteria bacterium]|nr:bifunctional UDP-sugar hydrolase/5'-nucleotidase [Gammaproteobacteria bacterium]
MNKLFKCGCLLTVLLNGNTLFGQDNAGLREITILYTNDEHGWMEGMSPDQGASNLVQLWQEQEGYSEDGPFLVLSGGDNWTGPAISTWVQGESMVDVMNAMHYNASAVGNHEFDFGLDAFAQRADEADFPYLGANIHWRENGEVPQDVGILPYTIVQVNDLSIGIIGLTTTSTPFVTNPDNVSGLLFTEYERAVRETLTKMSGTDLQFIIAHVCMAELETLLKKISDLGIDLIGGGHCNELEAREIGGTVVLGGGFHFTSYAKASFTFDIEKKELTAKNFGTARNRGASSDSIIEKVVSKWADSASEILDEVIAISTREIKRGEELEQLIINSWLNAYPNADIAVTNRGGIRADLPRGEITFADVVSILPFDNTIVSVRVTGQVIQEAIAQGGRPILAGLERSSGRWILTRTGEELLPGQEYTLLLNSFMYAGGDNFKHIAQANPDGFDTGVNFRQPFVDWLKNLGSSADKPIRF